MKPFLVGIRFQKIGKIYHFDASSCRDIQIGDFAIVETSRGTQLGEVITIIKDVSTSPKDGWKPILRKATPRDLVLRQIWQQKEKDALEQCQIKAKELAYQGVKVVAAEFTFDGSRLSFLYNTESESKVNLRKLRTAMSRIFQRSKVEFHQIGPRDVAKIIGGLGACGLDQRCCTKFLTEFNPISIRMAKEQGISLSPSEITGMCGRLRCCLIYEYQQYKDARKFLPKRKKHVETPLGKGIVVDVYPLKDSVLVLFEGGKTMEFDRKDVKILDNPESHNKKK
jgi:cell fate regulator YaaT (PSP1 superfamily)